jgi:hypothetical protein
MPADHAAAGLARAARVQPLDRDGHPSPNGKIVFLSVGMSNTTQEFCAAGNPGPCASWSFVGQAHVDPAVDRRWLVLVNGAMGGQVATAWDSPADANYDRVRDTDLIPAGLTELQVEVAWLKQANPQPTASLPNAAADAYHLETSTGDILRAMKKRYPNLQLVFLSSRIYAGYASTTLNPEPYAYETGLATKWVIQAQVTQRRSGVVDSRAGDLAEGTAAPWVGWGPYLWADGMNPRSDGLIWTRSDLEGDGTHPSQSGEQKVGALLLAFFKHEPIARPWFLAAQTPPRRRPSGH